MMFSVFISLEMFGTYALNAMSYPRGDWLGVEFVLCTSLCSLLNKDHVGRQLECSASSRADRLEERSSSGEEQNSTDVMIMEKLSVTSRGKRGEKLCGRREATRPTLL